MLTDKNLSDFQSLEKQIIYLEEKMTKKFNLSKSTAINSLKESIKILENREYSKARKTCSSRDYKKTQKKLIFIQI